MNLKTLVRRCHQNLLEVHARLSLDVIDPHSKTVALVAVRAIEEDAKRLFEVIDEGVFETLPRASPCATQAQPAEWDGPAEDGRVKSALTITCVIDARAKARKIVSEVLGLHMERAARLVPTEAGPEVGDAEVERLNAAFKANRIDANASRRS